MFFLFAFVFISSFLSACNQGPILQASEIIEQCRAKGHYETCSSDSSCGDICHRLFSRRADTQDCYSRPLSLVRDFEDLILHTQNGEIDKIDIEPLACLLDIDEREFARAVSKMDKEAAQYFLISIMQDRQLAEVLRHKDETYKVLEQIFYKITLSSSLQKILTEEIEGKKTVLWLSAEQESDYGWNYLDGYVAYKCDTGISSECPGREPIGAYCKALLEMKDSRLDDFLASADIFGHQYQQEVVDNGYSYTARDRRGGSFRDYCEGGRTGTGCPKKHPPESKLLAEIQFDNDEYISPNYRHRYGSNRDPEDKGESSPESNIILRLTDSKIFLNADSVDYVEGEKTWYLYVEGTRYDITSSGLDPYNSNNIELRELDVSLSSNLLNSRELEIHIASEKHGECEYYY